MNYLSAAAQARLALKQLEVDYTDDAFIRAARNGDLVVVELFVQAGGTIDVCDSDGLTPLLWAARAGQEAVVDFLVEHGADVSATDESGDTAIDWARQEGHTEVVEYLEGQGKVSPPPPRSDGVKRRMIPRVPYLS